MVITTAEKDVVIVSKTVFSGAEHAMTVANAMQKARRGIRPGFLHNFFRLPFIA
jgi:hypothetical protein